MLRSDLCESCESRVEHVRTHVFYKIKIPAPWAHKIAQKPWYPGKPELMPSTLPAHVTNRLKEKVTPLLSHAQQENVENILKGYFEQFSCIANTQWQEDPDSICMAINYDAFTRCVVDHAVTKDFPTPNLIHDRLFYFFDVDSNSLIDFEEFVGGILLIQSSTSDLKLERIFKALDMDADGFVTRKDFLLMFRAYYELHKSLLVAGLVNHHRGENDEHGPTLHDFAYGGRPLASYFASSPDNRAGRDSRLAHQGKHLDKHGDWMPDDESEGVVRSSGPLDEPFSRRKVIARHWRPHRQYVREELVLVMNRQSCNFLPLAPDNIAYDIPVEFRLGTRHSWALHNERVYIKPRFHQEGWSIPPNDLYLLVKPSEMPDADWRSRVDDEVYFLALNKVVITRLCSYIIEAIAIAENPYLEARSATQTFHLDDEKNDYNDTEDNEAPGTLIGDSAAAHTIYTITQQALNELLDPIFTEREFDIEQEKHALAPYQAELVRLHDQITLISKHSRALLEQQSPTTEFIDIDDFIAKTTSLISPEATSSTSTFQQRPIYGSWVSDIKTVSSKEALLHLISIRNWRFVWLNVVADSDGALWKEMLDCDGTPMTAWEVEECVRRWDMLKRFEQGGGPGKMCFEEFRDWVVRGDDGGGPDRLVRWVGSWLNLVVL